MTMVRLVVLCCLTLPVVAAGPGRADAARPVPTLGAPGNGFSVTPDGRTDFGGALHMRTPCAYTPARGAVVASVTAVSLDSRPRLQVNGEEVNTTVNVGVGCGDPGGGVYLGYSLFEAEASCSEFSAQWQVLAEDERRPAVAVGVLDLFDHCEDDAGRGRSWYLTATRVCGREQRPLYLTAGFGSDQLGGTLFVAASWYPRDRLNVGVEYADHVVEPHVVWQAFSHGSYQATLGLGLYDFDHPALGLAVSRTCGPD